MQTEVGLFDLGATEVRCLTRGPDLISVLCPFDGSDMWCRLAFSNGEVCIGEKFKTSVADHLRTTFASPSWGSWSARTKRLLRPTWTATELFPELAPPKPRTSFSVESEEYQAAVEAQRLRAVTRQHRKAVAAKDRVRPGTRWSNG